MFEIYLFRTVPASAGGFCNFPPPTNLADDHPGVTFARLRRAGLAGPTGVRVLQAGPRTARPPIGSQAASTAPSTRVAPYCIGRAGPGLLSGRLPQPKGDPVS